MKNLLWISFRVPYDTVAHAGGKIHNYYLKKLHATAKFNIKLMSFYNDSDEQKIDLEEYGIDSELINSTNIETDISKVSNIYNKIYKISGVNHYLDIVTRKMCKSALQKITVLKENGYLPDIVILQWTQIIVLAPQIKEMFPNAKIVSIEEDVTFLAAQRRQEFADSKIKKMYFSKEIASIKRLEKKCLEVSDLVVLNNQKDQKLLESQGIDANTWVWKPYFQNMVYISRQYYNCKDIIFYGAMNRPENWKSAIWFIENVFAKIKSKGYRFIVVGNKPHEQLMKYHNGNSIQIVGFVEDIKPYFENSMCLVAPLLLGAGVKIKILEAMSSGIPVLTNTIGIEGIFAENQKEFFLCKTADEYIEGIHKLSETPELVERISAAAKSFINQNYNYEKDAAIFCERLEQLLA